jgi:hypothetical protein
MLVDVAHHHDLSSLDQPHLRLTAANAASDDQSPWLKAALLSRQQNSSALDVDKFTQALDRIKSTRSSARCARSIRLALQSAGARFFHHPVAASDWGATLEKIGYTQIDPEFDHPQQGDIYIIHRTAQHSYGHIAGYSGSEWISDFRQASYEVYHETNLNYSYYRMI